MVIQAELLDFQAINEAIRSAGNSPVEIHGCCGQRYIGDGLADQQVEIFGTPGNALGAYLDGGTILVHGNAQDAVGDTMNEGLICIDGLSGDATGYSMRGGSIFVHGNVGYRAGIHMKEYGEQKPLLVVGGTAGSFLGEYQSGGTILVLGLHSKAPVPVNNFCGMGMYGGRIYLRAENLPADFSSRLTSRPAEEADLKEIQPALEQFCRLFGESMEEIRKKPFYVITPNSSSPYQQLYAAK